LQHNYALIYILNYNTIYLSIIYLEVQYSVHTWQSLPGTVLVSGILSVSTR